MMADGLLNLAELLAPLADGGADLRADFSPTSPYQKLRDARAEARAEERALDTAGEADPAVPQAWREVRRLGLACLTEQSRDFEVAAWLTEALVRLEGLEGLRAGAALLAGMLEQHWDAGHPRPDVEAPADEALEGRSAPLGGLAGESADGTLMQPLRRLALFRRADGRPVGLHLWQVAEDTEAIPRQGEENQKRRAARLKSGVPEMSALVAEARADAAHMKRLVQQARTAARAWAGFEAALSARFGDAAPSTRRVAEVLYRMAEIGERLVGAVPDRDVAAAPEAVAPVADAEAAPAAAIATGGAPRPLATRDDAIQRLEEIAEFFRRTEPHSPLAYTIDDAVRRARMPLPELLAEVLPDTAQRAAMLTMLGIRSAG